MGTQNFSKAMWVTDWTYFLRPIAGDETTAADEAEKVWRDLFSGMARDGQTREVLTQIHGDWPAQLLVVDPKDVGDDEHFRALPPEGVAIALRVADLDHQVVTTSSGPVPFRRISLGYVVHIQDANISGLTLDREEPLPGEALELAIEEYVLRHAPGYVARFGTGPNVSFDDVERLGRSAEEAQMPASVAEQREALDQKIEDYSAKFKAYYGVTGK